MVTELMVRCSFSIVQSKLATLYNASRHNCRTGHDPRVFLHMQGTACMPTSGTVPGCHCIGNKGNVSEHRCSALLDHRAQSHGQRVKISTQSHACVPLHTGAASSIAPSNTKPSHGALLHMLDTRWCCTVIRLVAFAGFADWCFVEADTVQPTSVSPQDSLCHFVRSL